MGAADAGGGLAPLASFLNYGPLGALALMCIIILGVNVWKLYDVVNRASAERARAIAPLLKFQMLVCGMGFTIAGSGALFLGVQEAKAERHLVLAVSPREYDVGPEYRPIIMVGGEQVDPARMRSFKCTPQTHVEVNFERYVRHRASEAVANSQALTPPPALGAVDPEI